MNTTVVYGLGIWAPLTLTGTTRPTNNRDSDSHSSVPSPATLPSFHEFGFVHVFVFIRLINLDKSESLQYSPATLLSFHEVEFVLVLVFIQVPPPPIFIWYNPHLFLCLFTIVSLSFVYCLSMFLSSPLPKPNNTSHLIVTFIVICLCFGAFVSTLFIGTISDHCLSLSYVVET